ncbi:retrovirus-related pol polyprotein from transposon TNT 1-94 [Tanacetum coccineum]
MAKEEVPSKLPQRVLVNASLKSINSTFAPLRISVRKEQHLINVQKVTGELKHTQAVFDNVINSIQNFNNIFNVFDRDILNEIMEVQTVFNQMDVAVQQFSVDKQCLEITKKELFLENDRLLQKIMSQDVLLTVMNSMSLIGESVNMDGKRKESCNLEAELLKSQNVFKEQFDSFKKACVRTKEQSDSLIEKLNLKFAENEDLKAQLQDKVFVTTSLKNDLRKIKGKEIVDIATQIPSTYTIVPGMFKLELEPLAPRLSDITDIGLWIFRKHMIGNRSQLMNFVSKFLGTVRFGNDNIARIIGLTWVIFLMTKDKAPKAIIKRIKNIQVRLNATVRNVRTDNGTEFVNQILHEFYENVGISHQTSVAHTPQQNGVVKRQNQTLKEVARTMLIFAKAPLFLWAEAINTACYTQNHSSIRLRYNKTPYELMQDKKPDLSFFHVFGALCYPTNDNDDLGKLDAKADIGIFVGYAPAKKAFKIYNKRTQKIIETIHVTFDELIAMASKQFSLGPGLHSMTLATSSSGLVPNPVSQQPCIPPNRDDWDHLFQPMFDEYFTSTILHLLRLSSLRRLLSIELGF